MADNDQIAASLRVLAESADDDVAEHDLNTLADALDSLDDNCGRARLSRGAAMEYLEEHNRFSGAVVIGQQDVEGELYVYEPVKSPELIDTPTGWRAYEADDYDGINFDPV
jgi:hypothetical protein